MIVEGQGPEGQPSEGITLSGLANMMEGAGESADEAEQPEGEVEQEIEVDGEEPDADPEAEQDDGEEPTFTIKVDGKDVTLKQSELLEQAQKGFDYTQKTMKVAEERRAVEAEKAKVSEFIQRHQQAAEQSEAMLHSVVGFLESQIGHPPSIELAQSDAYTYLAQKELYESRKGQLEQARHALQQVQQEQALNRQALVQQKAAEAEAELRSTLPDWSDAKLKDLSSYLGDLGLTPETAEMAYLTAGLWKLADKARAYDALLAKKAEIKPVQQPPKVIKATGNPQPPQLAKRQDAMKRHKAAPSINSLADLIG